MIVMAINKVLYGGNTLIDLTADTVTAADVSSGKTFHLPNGEQSVGTMVASSDIAEALRSLGFTIVSDSIITGTRTSGNTSQVFSDTGASAANGQGLIVVALDAPSKNQAVIRLEGNSNSSSCAVRRYPNDLKHGTGTNVNGFLQNGIRYRAIIYTP